MVELTKERRDALRRGDGPSIIGTELLALLDALDEALIATVDGAIREAKLRVTIDELRNVPAGSDYVCYTRGQHDRMLGELAAAVLAETERCAMIARRYGPMGFEIAAAFDARGDKS